MYTYVENVLMYRKFIRVCVCACVCLYLNLCEIILGKLPSRYSLYSSPLFASLLEFKVVCEFAS